MKPNAFLLLPSFIAATVISSQAQLLPGTMPTGLPAYAPGEILLQFNGDVKDAEVGEAFRQGGLRLIKHVQTPAMTDLGKKGFSRVLTAMPVPAAVQLLRKLPGVSVAEPNWVVTSQVESNDPLFTGGNQWGMMSGAWGSPFGSQAENAWASGIIGNKDVVVGVIDTGIQFDHPDLAANMWRNPWEIAANGVDDDGNGYVDDIHGWNTKDNNGMIYDPGQDAAGQYYDMHGTHVAGILGAVGGNGVGVAGINWNVSIIAGKFNGGGTGYIADAIEAIDYMTALKTRQGVNIVVLSNSWINQSYSQLVLEAITRTAQANILFVAAAGNWSYNNDVTNAYPTNYDTTSTAGYDAVISVASIAVDGSKAVSSSYGAVSVDLGAPGREIYSTVPAGGYELKNGTSMATPFVTGAIALYASTHPGASAPQIRKALFSTTKPTASLAGITATGGRLDVDELTKITSPPPAAPVNAQAVAIPGSHVNVSWTGPSIDEWGFTIERALAGPALSFALVGAVGPDILTFSDRSAPPGSTYYYRVNAYNAGGNAAQYAYTDPVTAPVVTLPLSPGALKGTALSKGGVSLTWTDNSNNETSFQLDRKTATGAWQLLTTLPSNSKAFTDVNTAKLNTYAYRVRAGNAAGFSAYSNSVSVKTR